MHLWRAHAFDIDMLTCPICNDYKTPTTGIYTLHLTRTRKENKCFFENSCRFASNKVFAIEIGLM